MAASFAARSLREGALGQATGSFLGRGVPLVSETMTTDERIAFWQGRVRPGAPETLNLTYLAQALIDKARESGDAADYGRAGAVLEQALAYNPEHAAALALMGAVRLSNHDFRGALETAERAFSADERALQALATIGDAQLELGNLDAAEAAYLKLNELEGGPEAAARLSRLAWLRGAPQRAIDEMGEAEAEARQLGLAGEQLAWYQFQLGELRFNTGDVRAAGRAYRAAAESFPGYHLAAVGLAKTAAATGDLDEAIALLEPVSIRLPQPEFLSLLGDLYARAGRPADAKQQYDTVLFIGELEERQQVLYNRALALFLANHDRELSRALALAQRELEARQDIYTYDVLAWTLHKNGRHDEAADAMAKALSAGTQDALLFYHAGMIAAARGETAEARTMLERALELNPHFSVLDAPRAQAMLDGLPRE